MLEKKHMSGLLVCVVMGIVAKGLSIYLPVLGSTSIAIILGAVIGNLWKNEKLNPGVVIAEKKMLEIAIGLMGITLNLKSVMALGIRGVLFIMLVMSFTIFVGIKIGEYLGFSKKFSMMVASGNAVCGSSAIAATAPVVRGEKEEIGVSITIVNLMGTIFMFLLPFVLMNFMKLTPIKSGALIGASLQSVGQVVAAGGIVGKEVQSFATLFKMIRVVMLGGVILLYSGMMKDEKNDSKSKFKIPNFIMIFFALCVLNSLGILPELLVVVLKWISKNFLIVAMVAIGMRINFSALMKEGVRAIVYGFSLSISQIIFTLILVKIFF